jgi:hypothetical protein
VGITEEVRDLPRLAKAHTHDLRRAPDLAQLGMMEIGIDDNPTKVGKF